MIEKGYVTEAEFTDLTESLHEHLSKPDTFVAWSLLSGVGTQDGLTGRLDPSSVNDAAVVIAARLADVGVVQRLRRRP